MRMKLKCKRKNARACGTMFRRAAALWVAAAACLLAISSPLLAGKKREKPPRTVSGIVSDASENPIVGAVVEMTDVQTGKKTAMYTQEGGHYEFSGLNPNQDYKIQATFKGVSSEVRTASSFDTRNTIRLNLQIPPPKDEDD
jgi:Carboxypeptidase regulatory-like domain